MNSRAKPLDDSINGLNIKTDKEIITYKSMLRSKTSQTTKKNE